MIENQNQYEITKRNIAGFETNLARLDASYAGQPEIAKRAARFEYQRELEKLRAELAEYERRQEPTP